jgi:5-(carboxyamino)imidazole ribonucleotide mutase
MPSRPWISLEIPHEFRVVSAHRTPDLLFEFAGRRGAGAEGDHRRRGGAAHLPGMVAAKTLLPVLGVPVQSQALKGVDSLLSIVQMPAGVPVGTLAIGRAGAVNAALLAAAIVATGDAGVRERLRAYQRSPHRGGPPGPGSLGPQHVSSPAGSPDPSSRPSSSRPERSRIGIVGGGQLGRMLALAGRPLGARFRFLEPADDPPVGRTGRGGEVALRRPGGPRAFRFGAGRGDVRVRERPRGGSPGPGNPGFRASGAPGAGGGPGSLAGEGDLSGPGDPGGPLSSGG